MSQLAHLLLALLTSTSAGSHLTLSYDWNMLYYVALLICIKSFN